LAGKINPQFFGIGVEDFAYRGSIDHFCDRRRDDPWGLRY